MFSVNRQYGLTKNRGLNALFMITKDCSLLVFIASAPFISYKSIPEHVTIDEKKINSNQAAMLKIMLNENFINLKILHFIIFILKTQKKS